MVQMLLSFQIGKKEESGYLHGFNTFALPEVT